MSYLEAFLLGMLVIDVAIRLLSRKPLSSPYELKCVIREALVEYGAARSPSRELLESITDARARTIHKGE